MTARRSLGLWLIMACAGCASYQAAPLDQTPHLASSLAELQQSAPEPQLDIATDRPLTSQDIVRLVLRFDPDLRVARDDRAIAQAQVLQAGLLPNPQFSGTYGFLLAGPGTINAFAVGLAEDIRALIVRGAQRASAEQAAQRVDADLLWQEWQIVGKARLLFVDLVEEQKLRIALQNIAQLAADRYHKDRAALAMGDADLTTVAPDLGAMSDLDRQLNDLDRQIQANWIALDALLGLQPDVRFALEPAIALAVPDAAQIKRVLSDLPTLRPDLMALRIGYLSQEEKVRTAILGQFPPLVIGGNYGSDNSHVLAAGPTVSLELPIFNHNEGNIAIETATRQKLRDDYAARLQAATGEVEAMLSNQSLARIQYRQALAAADAAEAIAGHADNAFQTGNIDERTYVDLKTTAFAQRQRAITLEQILLEQQVGMATLIGTDMPALEHPSLPKETP